MPPTKHDNGRRTVSTTYPTGRRTRKLSVLEALGPVLREAGLVEPENYEFTGNARMVAAALALGLRQIESTDPWGDPFALVIRADWCSIDGTEPGDLQMRVSPYGVQIRERTPSTLACVELNHFSQTCENCWTTRMMNPETQWYSASERVQVRIDPIDEDATTCRAEIQRRIDQHHVQPEAVWSEPWAAPNYSSTEFHKEHRSNRNIDTTWVSVANDVQISEGHTFPRGVLVRQATGRDDTPWTTPRFLAETHWRWVDLIPDGSMQLRCWRPREEERNYGNSRIEVRQRVGRKPVLVAEPTWGKSKSGHFVERTEYSNGYALTLFLDRNRYGGYRGVEGLRVVTPQGETIEILDYDRDIQATPDLLVHPSYQGYFWWKHAISEPETAPTLWTMPEERLLRSKEWTLLDTTVRAKLARSGRGVQVETLLGAPVRRHWWSRPSLWLPRGTKSFGTMHHLGDTLRVTFRPDQMAEIQRVVPAPVEQ
jgi:hypothetical protein